MDSRTRLVVLFGGQSAEHEVSCVSARHVLAAVDTDRYVIDPIGIAADGRWVRSSDAMAMLAASNSVLPARLSAEGDEVDPLPMLAAAPEAERTVVLPILHGPMGEDGTVQGLLELAGVPYVGTGVLGSALCMDKIAAKEMAAQHGIAQCRFLSGLSGDLSETRLAEIGQALGWPVFVKPANMGSSVGVSKAENIDELVAAASNAGRFDESIVFEEGVVAREIEVAVLGNRGAIRASVPGEIVPGDEFYSFDDKYTDGVAETLVPASLDPELAAEVRDLAVVSAEALRVEGLARVDFFYEEGGRGFLLNEINTMPGFTPISMYPKLWAESGLDYPSLINELVSLAIERHERRTAHRSTVR